MSRSKLKLPQQLESCTPSKRKVFPWNNWKFGLDWTKGIQGCSKIPKNKVLWDSSSSTHRGCSSPACSKLLVFNYMIASHKKPKHFLWASRKLFKMPQHARKAKTGSCSNAVRCCLDSSVSKKPCLKQAPCLVKWSTPWNPSPWWRVGWLVLCETSVGKQVSLLKGGGG